MDPLGLTPEDVPDDVPADQREERALLTQAFVKEPDKTVQQLVGEAIASTGENIRISRFVRYELGRAAPDS